MLYFCVNCCQLKLIYFILIRETLNVLYFKKKVCLFINEFMRRWKNIIFPLFLLLLFLSSLLCSGYIHIKIFVFLGFAYIYHKCYYLIDITVSHLIFALHSSVLTSLCHTVFLFWQIHFIVKGNGFIKFRAGFSMVHFGVVEVYNWTGALNQVDSR